MTIAMMQAAGLTASPAELVPQYFDPELIEDQPGNPTYTRAMVAELLECVREHGQLLPGYVCPSPDLPDQHRLCLEGHRRLTVARMLGLKFWAFDLGRPVAEEERIKLTFQYNHARRVMSREEIARQASRYMELTRCTAAVAAKLLNVSEATLSRALGEKRIPAALRERAARLLPTIRSLIAAMPASLMDEAMTFAETPLADGRMPTRDQVALHLQGLKKSGKAGGRDKAVTLRINGRPVTLLVTGGDNAASVAKDLNAILARLAKLGDVPPEGWPFHFV